jgi:hypothetical protein
MVAPTRRPVSVPLGRDLLARRIGDLTDGVEEVLLELAQAREGLLQLRVGKIAPGRHHLAEGGPGRLGRPGKRLVHAAKGVRERHPQLGAALVGAERRALGHRAHHLADAAAVETAIAQPIECQVAHLGADVRARAHRLARCIPDLFVAHRAPPRGTCRPARTHDTPRRCAAQRDKRRPPRQNN